MPFPSRTLPLLTVLAVLGGCAHHAPVPAQAVTPSPAENAAQTLLHRDFREALRQYDILHKAVPADPGAAIGLGEAWLGLGEARPALTVFTEFLAQHPLDADGMEGLGLAYLGLQDYPHAQEYLERVLLQRPQSWRALNGLGLVADMEANYPKAKARYEQALAARPDEPSIYNNHGYSRLMAGDFPGAEVLLAQAVRLSPGNARLRNNLMQAVARQGDYRRALSLRGDIPRHEALNNVGYIAWLRQDKKEARRFFEQAIDISPGWYHAAAANLERLEQETAAASPPPAFGQLRR